MRLKAFLAAFAVFFTWFQVHSQSIRGELADTINFKPLAFSSVSLIRESDSILIAHQWTDQQNRFMFKSVPEGIYILQITRPGFADYEDRIRFNNQELDLGAISLIAKANLLREVVIREKLDAIRLKGDTTEFLADSFQVRQGATVEDLLKKLPGIQVDRTGKITAQGETVKQVLVDGEEFFGDDPTVATRNLKAENIESVQVFDKKSETALQTGVDDGEKNKTINLKLKDDAKKGYFGKASAGAGTKVENKNRYEADAMFNFFKNKRKFSIYGAGANTNKTNMNWRDANKYGAGDDNVTFDEESGMVYSFYNEDESDINFDGKGIPRTWYTGAHYSNKFNENKTGVNVNLTRKEMRVDGWDSTYTQYILPDTLYSDRQSNIFSQFKAATKGSAILDFKPDSLTSIRFKSQFSQTETQDNSLFGSQNLNENDLLVNSNSRKNTQNFISQNLENTLTYNRKFAKKGRSLNLSFNHQYRNTTGDGLLGSRSNFFNGVQQIISSDSIDQLKTTESGSTQLGGKVAYTEPLSKLWFLVTDYNLNHTASFAKRSTLGRIGQGYSDFVDSLSSNFDYDIWAHNSGLTLRRVTKKLNYSFGGRMAYTVLDQFDRLKDSTQSRNFINFFPSAGLNYKVSTTTFFGINYSGRTQQPAIQALQPLRDNTNPLNLYIGNPGLKQSFTNSVSFNFNTFKPISGRGMYASLNYSITNNAFASSNYVDAQGRRIYQTVNVDGNQNLGTYIYYYMTLKSLNVDLNASLNANISKNRNFVNFVENVNNNQNLNIGFYPSYSLGEWLEVGFNCSWNFTRSTSSLRPDVVTSFWTSTYTPWLNLVLPYGFRLDNDIDFNRRQTAYESNQNLNTMIWNARLNWKIPKHEQFQFGISGYDLLNQNVGFSRYASSNFVTQNVYSNLKRYVLFSLTYNINNAPGDDD